jgi:hypothetical protein
MLLILLAERRFQSLPQLSDFGQGWLAGESGAQHRE